MINILSRYSINPNTIALLPVTHIDYDTLALETNRKLYVKQTQFEIIKESCLSRYVTYEGIKLAVQKKTGFKRKVPIPLSPHQNIYIFPTHATDDFGCCWISYYHVHQINQAANASSFITFKNEDKIQINISAYVLKKQMKRTLECINGYVDFEKMVQYS